jgi:hypothetical protein
MSDVTTLQQTATYVHALALALSLAAIVWAAMLAGLCRVHWFWRMSLLCVPLVMLLPIRAYEPLVLLAPLMTALAVSAACLRGAWEGNAGRRQNPPSRQAAAAESSIAKTWRLRISLADSLLGMTLIGIVLATLVQMPWRNLDFSWIGLLFDASVIYGIAIACLGIVGMRKGTLWAVLLFAGIFLGTVFVSVWGDGLQALYLLGFDAPHHLNWVPLGIFFLAFVTLLIVALWLTRWCGQVVKQPELFAQRRRLVGSWLAMTLAPGVVLYIAMFAGPAEVPGPSVRNNSLPQIIEAALRLESLGLDDLTLREVDNEFPDTDFDEQVAAIYAESQRLVKQPGCVAIDVGRQGNVDSLPAQEAQIEALHTLARRWSREADHAYRAGNVRRAVEFDLDVLRLGNQLARGGIRMHLQAAAAIKSAGLSHLAQLREHLPLDLVPVVISVLESLDAGEENPQLSHARDRYWTDLSHGWRHRLESVVQRTLGLPNTETAAFHALKQPLAREALHRRLLATELALRHYYHEHAAYPATLAALAPARIALQPIDPYTLHPLIYRPFKYSFVLYSTGPDAADNGGKFARFASENAFYIGHDWNLDTLQRGGWRNGRREWYSGQGPRTGVPAGPGAWGASPWERSSWRGRDFVSSPNEQAENRDPGSVQPGVNQTPTDQRVSQQVNTENQFNRRSFDNRWRGRRGIR